MGQVDAVTKKYIGRQDIFADVFNQFVYKGKQVIRPELLREMDATQIALPYGTDGTTVPVQKFRDVEKLMLTRTDGETAYCLLGVENQADINYAMPVKNGLYDFMQLSGEVTSAAHSYRGAGCDKAHSGEFLSGFRRGDRLLPVITLVFYFGAAHWDGPTSLREMYRECDPVLLQYAPDYRINLISPSDMSDAEIELFQTNMREISLYIKYSTDKKMLPELLMHNTRFRDMDTDAVDLINKVTGSKLRVDTGKEKTDMCAGFFGAMEDSKMEGMREGRMEGRMEGQQQGIQALVDTCKKFGIGFEETLKQLQEEFSLDASVARQNMTKYW